MTKSTSKELDITAARLSWDNDTPMSELHQDIYFTRANGLAETRHVFLEQNRLPLRWKEFSGDADFTIVETGFGTGLNFLTTWLLWQQCEEPKPHLCFVSIEKFPLTPQDLKKCLDLWPELGDLRQQLIDACPPLMKGNHQIHFEHGKVQLNLIIGDVNEDLERYPFSADCWYLDGFSPSKNTDMWQDSLFELMRRRSKPNATFSTFTAAGFVRRALKDKGFQVERVQGFGPKREMLRGQLVSPYHATEFFSEQLPKWAYGDKGLTTQHTTNTLHTYDADAIVIGAGLAGITTAHALAQHGLKVLILERGERAMSGASGQDQLALYAKLPSILNKESRFFSKSLLFSQRYLSELQTQYPNTPFWHPSGLLQLAWNDAECIRLEKLSRNTAYPESLLRAVSPEEASALCGLEIEMPGLWFEKSGWLNPHAYAQSLLSHKGIELRCNTRCLSIQQDPNHGHWIIVTQDQMFKTPSVVLACAYETPIFQPFISLPLKALRGQVTSIESARLAPARSVVCGEGYLCPPQGNRHHFGATYDLMAKHSNVTHEDNLTNIATLQQWLPNWLAPEALTAATRIDGNAGIRCTTPDYFPIAGAVPKQEEMVSLFAPLRHNANTCKTQHGRYYPGLFINAGHGSKGLTTIPLCSEWICAQITGKASMMDEETILCVHPARFLIRQLIHNRQ